MDQESMTTDQTFMMYPAGSYYGYYYPGLFVSADQVKSVVFVCVYIYWLCIYVFTSYSSFLPGYDATFGGGSNDQLYYAAGDGTELQYTVRNF
jgi:hypothetical protein